MAAFSPADLKRLQWNIVLLIFLALIGAAAALASIKFREIADKALKEAATAQGEIRSKLARASEEENELREKIIRYNALDQRGILGEEHRLDWIEQIRKVKENRKLLELQYELAPQKPIDARIVPAAGSGFDVLSSPMKLELPLLHEMDLLNFLNDLNVNVQAWLRLGSCSIERIPAQAAAKGPTAQLRAACELDWITIREKR